MLPQYGICVREGQQISRCPKSQKPKPKIGFAQKVTCQQYSTASEATGWHTQRTKHQNLALLPQR